MADISKSQVSFSFRYFYVQRLFLQNETAIWGLGH